MGELYAIVVLRAKHFRDHKLKLLQNVESNPDWEEILKIRSLVGKECSVIHTKLYECSFSKKTIRRGLDSASRWKTRRGAENALKIISKINYEELKGDGLIIVNIKKEWNDLINSQILQNKDKIQRIIERLEDQLIF
jgi:hypothetical protein